MSESSKHHIGDHKERWSREGGKTSKKGAPGLEENPKEKKKKKNDFAAGGNRREEPGREQASKGSKETLLRPSLCRNEIGMGDKSHDTTIFHGKD